MVMKVAWRWWLVNEFFHRAQEPATWQIVIALALIR